MYLMDSTKGFMPRFLFALFVYAFSSMLILYSAFALFNADLTIGNWSVGSRAFCGFLAAIGLIFSAFFAQFHTDEREILEADRPKSYNKRSLHILLYFLILMPIAFLISYAPFALAYAKFNPELWGYFFSAGVGKSSGWSGFMVFTLGAISLAFSFKLADDEQSQH